MSLNRRSRKRVLVVVVVVLHIKLVSVANPKIYSKDSARGHKMLEPSEDLKNTHTISKKRVHKPDRGGGTPTIPAARLRAHN